MGYSFYSQDSERFVDLISGLPRRHTTPIQIGERDFEVKMTQSSGHQTWTLSSLGVLYR
jgi:hypothetical protein